MEQMETRSRTGSMVDFPWWVFLITGIAWMIIAVIVLRYQTDPLTSVATVGVLIGALFVFAAINEFVAAGMVDTWKWLHWLMGFLFVLGALYGFFRPYARYQGGMFAEPWHLSYAPVSMRAIDDLSLDVLRRCTEASDIPGKARVLELLPEILERHVRNIVPPPPGCAW